MAALSARMLFLCISICALVAPCRAASGKRFLQAATEVCYGAFTNLVAEEGNDVGMSVSTSSSTECQAACTGNANCQSFSLCPQWNGCWMKDRALTGSEATVTRGQCRTFYRIACSAPNPVPVPTPAPTPILTPAPEPRTADFCYGAFQNLVAEEGQAVGSMVRTSSSADCETACTNNADCQSFSLCPQWNGCWMKNRALTGTEATVVNGQCRTYYKTACTGPFPTSGPESPPSEPPAPEPPTTDVCYGEFSNLVVQEGNDVGSQVATSSPAECQAACNNNADCQSFSLCPQFNGCWMKDRTLTGTEPARVFGQCRTYYKTSCSAPTLAPTLAPPLPTVPPLGDDAPYCGIVANVYQCRHEVNRLRAIDQTVGDSFARMCMGYGGTHPRSWEGETMEDRDMCTLNINNDCDHWFLQNGDWTCARNYGIEKSPLECHGRYFFLWDEPMTQGLDAVWAAEQWMRHVARWGPQIRAMRANGTRVTTPLFTDHGGPAAEKFQAFFTNCPQCSNSSSDYYIDVLGTNQWLLSPQSSHSNREEWIRDEVNQISRNHDNRPVVLGNFAWLNGNSADQQVEAIANSRIWDRTWSGLEAVFYFGATDFGGNTTNNFLSSQTSTGSSIAEALVNRCRAYNVIV